VAESWPALVVALGVGVLAWRVSWLDGMWAAIAWVLVPIAAVYGLMQYRDTGWTVDGQDRLLVRGRRIERHLTVTPRRRLQRRTVSQNLFQRRADLANVTVAVASGGSGGALTVRQMDLAEAEGLILRLAPQAGYRSHASAGAEGGRPVGGAIQQPPSTNY
jgi:putative membrane protein